MDKWKKALHQDVTDEHEAAVLKAVGPLLQQNAKLASEAASPLQWWVYVLPALALGAVAIAILPRVGHKSEPGAAPPPAMSMELEIAMDYELYRDLREIEKLDLLRQLGDESQWPVKRAKPRKS